MSAHNFKLRPTYAAIADLQGAPAVKEQASIGVGLSGAERTTREMASWFADPRPADAIINPAKEVLDARARDVSRNDGFVSSATTLTKDSIVGNQFVLNATPNQRVLGPGADDAWAEEFQAVVEARFNLMAESPACWFDAGRRNTFTDLVRLAVGNFVVTGEVLGTSEWIRQNDRPFATAFQMLNPDLLCNPNDGQDTRNIRRGVVVDQWDAPLAYWFRQAHRFSTYVDPNAYTWRRVDARLPWGRPQVLHLFEQLTADQSRGIAAMVAVLKEMQMTRRYRDIVLQNAVTNATYAAAIESELPSEAVYASLGGNQVDSSPVTQYLANLSEYVGSGTNVQIDGVKIPHLYPGTKLKFYPAQPVGDSTYEDRLLRHLAAAFGLSHEEFSRDFTKTNYSSARAAGVLSWRHMNAKKKIAADGLANFIYGNWLEEQIGAGEVPLPAGMTRADFYRPMMREAFCSARWIGAARGQIDEGKETDAAVARIEAGLSTYEDELARLGKDWRAVFKQRLRERAEMIRMGILPTAGARSGMMSSQIPPAP